MTLFINQEKLGIPFSSQRVEGRAAITAMKSLRSKGVIAEEISHLFLIGELCRKRKKHMQGTECQVSTNS